MASSTSEQVFGHPTTSGVLGGLVGLVPVGKLRGSGKAAFILVPPGTVLGAALVAAGSVTDQSARKRLVRKALGAAAGVGVSQSLWIVSDRAMEEFLRRRDVTRPRVVIAVLGAAASVTVALLTGRLGAAAQTSTSATVERGC